MLRAAGAEVRRATEHFPRGTEDEVWLREAGKNNWIVLTRDKRIRYRQLERVALQQAGVRVFVFTGGNVTIATTAHVLVSALPQFGKVCRDDPGPFLYHFGRSGKPRKMRRFKS
jgi:predicted nuclease of predicted toxin-antitoxin system